MSFFHLIIPYLLIEPIKSFISDIDTIFNIIRRLFPMSGIMGQALGFVNEDAITSIPCFPGVAGPCRPLIKLIVSFAAGVQVIGRLGVWRRILAWLYIIRIAPGGPVSAAIIPIRRPIGYVPTVIAPIATPEFDAIAMQIWIIPIGRRAGIGRVSHNLAVVGDRLQFAATVGVQRRRLATSSG